MKYIRTSLVPRCEERQSISTEFWIDGIVEVSGRSIVKECIYISRGITEIPAHSLINYNVGVIAFEYRSQLVSVRQKAFRTTVLKEVELPASLREICDGVFLSCHNLAVATFESGSQLASVGNNTFQNWVLKDIVLPVNLHKICGGVNSKV